jgi:hypothetical protein
VIKRLGEENFTSGGCVVAIKISTHDSANSSVSARGKGRRDDVTFSDEVVAVASEPLNDRASTGAGIESMSNLVPRQPDLGSVAFVHKNLEELVRHPRS